ncbi:spore maturation protein CgeB [Desulfomicrobium norvegicum]|uniref:Spore maturation protein CgeB n=1 Tax=Desulfomicrobium norvegicum (strain DSM 1741 / NCIMB 8310) TaxID=52561 RepID=A0A8G2C584_DESNO|nr:glycosyltransferase [Desulfomicrobium norvegicum]SFM08012.1 spore maturation protein CgeB [Desulfomicrobium norvegicum]
MNRSARKQPRILLISAKHYLMAELICGCQARGLEHAYLFLGGISSAAELEEKLRVEVDRFAPDFLLTMNHLGLDREGLVSEFCRQRELPLLSWFVDRPDLFLPQYRNLDNPCLAYAVWDADAIEPLADAGHGAAFHLPLAVDLSRIHFVTDALPLRDVAFVGNSMQAAQEKCWALSAQSDRLRGFWEDVAGKFTASDTRDLSEFVGRENSEAGRLREACEPSPRAALDSFVYWRATQLHRLKCMQALLPFEPVVAGDEHWRPLLGDASWTYAGPLHYYSDLPGFYRSTRINFNTTSMQMKGALNQRVFDVPASGGFLLTDYREQLAAAFELGKEVVCYRDVEEIGDLVRHYLANSSSRERIALRARQRIEKEHSYGHRMATICANMKRLFGTPA